MKPRSNLNKPLILLLLVLSFFGTRSQQVNQGQVVIEDKIRVNSSMDRVWLVLSDFSGVGSFHALYDESSAIKPGSKYAAVGAERESLMPDGMYNVILKERVIDLVEGSHYTFEVYESENTPLESMQVTYGLRTDAAGFPEIYSRLSYDMGSAVKTNMSKRRFRKSNKLSLLSYKYYIETGLVEKDLKRLRKWSSANETDSAQTDLIAGRN